MMTAPAQNNRRPTLQQLRENRVCVRHPLMVNQDHPHVLAWNAGYLSPILLHNQLAVPHGQMTLRLRYLDYPLDHK
jgi:hypothetical protein